MVFMCATDGLIRPADSNPAGGTEKFAVHMAFMRDIQTRVPSTCHPPKLSSARLCVLEGTFQFGAAMLRSSLRHHRGLVWSCPESNPPKSP